MQKILGIDPGATGAAALLGGRHLVDVWDMPTVAGTGGRRRVDAAAFADLVAHHVRQFPRDGIEAVIELVGPMPRDGSAGSFWFGKSAGICEGVLAGLGIPVRLVTPQAWKRRLDVPTHKDGARERATVLLGCHNRWPLKKNHGRAEAALIALWGYMDKTAGNW